MKKNYLFLIFTNLIFPFKILAGGVQLQPPISATSIPEVIERLSNFIFTLAIYFLPVVAVSAGIFLITAGGNIQQIERGKKLIIYGLIGFVIILVATGLIRLFRETFLR